MKREDSNDSLSSKTAGQVAPSFAASGTRSGRTSHRFEGLPLTEDRSPRFTTVLRSSVTMILALSFVASCGSVGRETKSTPVRVPKSSVGVGSFSSSSDEPLSPWDRALTGRVGDGRPWDLRVASGTHQSICSSFDFDGSAKEHGSAENDVLGGPVSGGYRFSCIQAGDDPLAVLSWDPNALASSGKGHLSGGYIAGHAAGTIISMNASGGSDTTVQFVGANFVVWFGTMPDQLNFRTAANVGHCALGNFDGSPIGPCQYATEKR